MYNQNEKSGKGTMDFSKPFSIQLKAIKINLKFKHTKFKT
jgi:hypothetical protein